MRKHFWICQQGSQLHQILCALLINLPVVSYGMAVGWMSPMTLLLQSPESPLGEPLSDTVISWMASVPYLIITPCALLAGYLADRWGRKVLIMGMSTCLALSWTLLLCSMSTTAFILSRCLMGISSAPGYVICPLYTREISEDRNRGALVSLVIVSQTLGNLLMYIIGDMLSYNLVLMLCLSVPVIHLVLFLSMPESPSYLVKKGREHEALKAMSWLRCRSKEDSIVRAEIDCLEKEEQRDKETDQFALKAILKDQILRKAFMIAMVVTIAREVCGAHPVLNFAGSIFDLAAHDSHVIMTPNQQAIMLGAVQFCGACLAVTVVEKLGRKYLLFTSSLLSGLSMCILATWFLLKQYLINAPGWLPLTTLCMSIFCDSFGLQPISVVVLNELFSFKYRGTVSAVTMSSTSIADFLQLLLFKPVESFLGIHTAFYFFGSICLLHALFVILCLPETKRRSVEEIYRKLGSKCSISPMTS